MIEARMWKKEDDAIRCGLCPHGCLIRERGQGICGVRGNRDGRLYALTYGKVVSAALDPIEKKPLFHFLPGTTTYSLGGIGCTFRCRHCQNWEISQAKIDELPLREIQPEEGVAQAERSGAASITWTYNEPTIWHEYALDMGRIGRKRNLKTIYVTNGYITEEALNELSPMLSAFRVDIKAFNDEFYKQICGGRLQPVLDATIRAHELGMHIETVTLVIPGLNDDPAEIDTMIRWVIEHLGPETPMHFTRYHPDYQMNDPPATPLATLERIYSRAQELGLKYPYLGNIPGSPYEDTRCPSCGAELIRRRGFSADNVGLDGDRCGRCGERIPLILS
ncbi:AmmeMemoRadiSam system radical SAM enzyme [Methanocalculus taiwanensis]|uniref:AmmeMemoRadiSam system radical SAM enzyme n=1 Tax=Methanocalculus taiwanensis TaxID=106207 RepID=A0ABD4TH11_9EURY|nr:AmmeMemoRadiSam system radical SAM enzyme [Methanocalculus taiwanensis]MCQ1537791.1 AmmeMemoRadiSam system radical SAM enzyme [Methanocalculus taiwanensis]